MYAPYSFLGSGGTQPIYTAISCLTTASYNIQFAGGFEYPIGTIFESNTQGIQGDCLQITSIYTSSLNVTQDVVSIASYSVCADCSNTLPTNGLVFNLTPTSLTGSVWYDTSGNNNHALISGSLTLSGGSYVFGSASYLTFPVTLTNGPTSSQWTQMIYGKPNKTNAYFLYGKKNYIDGWDSVMTPPETVYNNVLVFRQNITGNKDTKGNYVDWSDNIYNNLFTQVIGSSSAFSSYPTFDFNYVFNKTYQQSFWFNLDAPLFTQNSEPLRFGFSATTDAKFFSGSLNNLLLYNRSLTTAEIFRVSNYLETPNVLPPGLVLWSDTTSLTGSVWYDRSGNNNHGLVSGSTLSLSGSLGYAFNGTNNYITYPSNLQPANPTSNWTVMVYGTMYNDNVNRDLWTKDSYANGWDIVWNGVQDIKFRDSAGFDVFIGMPMTSYDKGLATFTLSGTGLGTANSYLNNQFIQIRGNVSNNGFNASGLPLKFGWNADTDATFFKGTATALLVFNRELNQTEVSKSYAYLSASYS
jgi:hypothetical protein